MMDRADDSKAPSCAAFDAEFYLASCPQGMQSLDAASAYQHYLKGASDQCIFPSASAFLEAELSSSKFAKDAKEIAASFSWKDYRDLNEDLRSLNPLQLAKHYLENGILEPRQTSKSAGLLDRRFAIQAKLDRVLPRIPIQIVVHCYYFDVLCDLRLYLRTLARLGAHILVLVVNDHIQDLVMDEFLRSLRTDCTQHTWKRVANHGEDWSSLHHAFSNGLLIDTGIIYKIQTKKSANLGPDGGVAWIDEALQPICGSYSAVFDVVELFSTGRRSIVASTLCRQTGFGANRVLVESHLKRLGLCSEAAENASFCMGSMFAVNAECLGRYFSLLGPIDYQQPLVGGTKFCGRYQGHAMERTIFYFAGQADGDDAVAWID